MQQQKCYEQTTIRFKTNYVSFNIIRHLLNEDYHNSFNSLGNLTKNLFKTNAYKLTHKRVVYK